MEGTIINYRGSQKQKSNYQMIIQLKDKVEAEKVIGKEVIWKSPTGKEIKGEINALHGRNGAVRAKFEKGLPGQSLGQKVEINV